MSRPRFHALIIGIDEFQHQRNLSGCVNDATRFADYLTRVIGRRFLFDGPQCLFNAAATREAFLDAFETYLIKPAQEGDSVLLYFSGHGGQEVSPPEFLPYEHDRLLEGLVCHDTGTGGAQMIADKELRYLFHKLGKKKVEITMVFDCCHAGDNNRNKEDPGKVERRLSERAPGRKWEEFCFSSDPSFSDPAILKEKHLDELMPMVKSVHLAACKDHESAYEDPFTKSGYFTTSLLEVLEKTGGNLTNLDLQRRVQQQIKKRHLVQTPQIYVPRGHSKEMFRTFLFGDPIDQPVQGNIAYDGYEQRWNIDLGGIHGLAETGTPLVVDLGEDRSINAAITEIGISQSRVAFPPDAKVSHSETYKGMVSGLMMDALTFSIVGEQKGVEMLQQFFEHNRELLETNGLELVQDAGHAAYIVRCHEGKIHITLSNDTRPLTREIEGYHEHSCEIIFTKLLHIGKWSFVKKLQNPAPTSIPSHPFRLILHPVGQPPVIYDPRQGFLEMDHVHPSDFPQGISMSFEFVNQSGKELYAACFYLSRLYAVEVDYLQPPVLQFAAEGPQSRVKALSGQAVRVRMPGYIHQWNWSHEIIYFKILMATEPFDVGLFALPELDDPNGPLRNSKGFDRDVMMDFQTPEWKTQLFELRLRNPLFTPKA